MTFQKKLAYTAVALASVVTCQLSMAQKAGDTFLYGGLAYSKPNSSLGQVSDSQVLFTPQTNGTTASVQNFSTPIVSMAHMYTDNWGIELTLGIPPKLKSDVTAPNAAAPLISSTMSSAISQNALFPSVVGMYFFKQAGETFRPYVGFGVNYTTYNNITPNTSYSTVAAFAGNGVGLSNSWNPVYKFGGVYNIDERWSINAGVSYVPLSTNVTLQANPAYTHLPNQATAKLTINPTDLTFKVGYKF